MSPAQRVAAVLAAAAVATPLIVKWEGWERVAYSDLVGVPTVCAGATRGVVKGKTYTDRECMDLLARDVVEHAMRIDRCLPENTPPGVRAAFISTAYNIGADAFCGSSMSRRAMAGDFKGACAALSLWVKAGGREVRGLTLRRAEERQAYCEAAL